MVRKHELGEGSLRKNNIVTEFLNKCEEGCSWWYGKIAFMRYAPHYMNFQFVIGDTALDNTEAKALLSAAGKKTAIVVDIAEHIDPAMIDSKKLFSISVETKNPTLASLAARFAIEGIETPKKRSYKRTEANRLSHIEPKKTINDSDEAIGELCKMSSLKAIGAAMILDGVAEGHTRTLRQIATSCVNAMAYRGSVSADSQCFAGFCKDGEGHYRTLNQGPNVPRSACYHASPMYTAIRDGAQLLKEWGLIELKELIEFGSNDKEITENSQQLRRVVYAVSATEMGRKVAADWGDIFDFISHRWSSRIRDKKSYAA